MNTIKVKAYSKVMEEYNAADANIVPGHLLELTSAGKVDSHSNDEGRALPMFACEDELQGKAIDDKYAADAPVQVWIPYRGDIVNAILAVNENVAIGDYLVSNGNGELRKADSDESLSAGDVETQIIGQAVVAVDLSDSSDAYSPTPNERRVQVRIL